jgi:CRP-like cAMP-binding protein
MHRNMLRSMSSWFQSLPDNIQQSLHDAGRVRRIAAGGYLFCQGDPPSGLHAILDGQLHVVGTARTGHELLMAIHRPGDWVGFLTCLDRQPHPLSGRAVTELTVFTVTPAAISTIFETDVATYKLLLNPELRVDRSNYHWLVEMLVRPSLQRVAARILQLSRWVHGGSDNPPSPIEHVNQEELASACTLSRQTMNTALRELEGKGLVKIGYGRIEVLDGAALFHFAMTDPKEFSEL